MIKLIFAFVAFICSISSPLMSNDLDSALLKKSEYVAKELRASESFYDQIAGAGILLELGDKDSLRYLVENIIHTDWVLMRSAIDTLLSSQHPSGVDAMYRAMETVDDPIFRKFLAESLANKATDDMHPFLIDMVSSEDEWVRKHAMQALDRINFDGKEDLMRKLAYDSTNDIMIRAYAFMSLLSFDNSKKHLESILRIGSQRGDSASQEAAAVGLGRIDNPKSRKALAALRKEGSPMVSIAALSSEVGLGIEDSRNLLIKIILEGKGLDPSVASASIKRLPRSEAVSISNELFNCCVLSSDTGTRLLESWSVLGNPPDRVYDWGLANDNADIQLQAVWLVGYTNSVQHLDKIVDFLNSNDMTLKAMAAWSIVRLLLNK